MPRDEVTQDQLEHLVEEAVLTVTSRLTAASEAMEDLIEAAMSEGNRRAASTVIEGAWWAKRWFRAFGTPFEELLHEALVRIPGVAVNLAAAGKLTSRFSPLTPVRLVVRRARFTALSDLRERERHGFAQLDVEPQNPNCSDDPVWCAQLKEFQEAMQRAIETLEEKQKLAVGVHHQLEAHMRLHPEASKTAVRRELCQMVGLRDFWRQFARAEENIRRTLKRQEF